MKNTIVIKRDGNKENFHFDKILKHLKDATKDLKNVDYNEIIANLKLRMKPEMPSKEIQDSLIQSAADLIDKEKPNYQYVAARLMLQDLYKEVYGDYNPNFDSKVLKERIKKGYYADYVLDYYTEDEIDELAKVINYENDLKFTYSGLWQMKKKYMVKRNGKPIETPQETFFLVSLYNYIKIKNKRDRIYYVKNTYKALANFEIFLSTPPMVGIRTKMRGWTSCFKPDYEIKVDYLNKEKIGNLKIGDEILTPYNNKRKVTNIIKSKKDEFVKIRTVFSSEILDCTIDHPIYAIKKDDVRCIRSKSRSLNKICLVERPDYKCHKIKDWYKNDCSWLNKDFSNIADFYEADELKKGDYIAIPFSKKVISNKINIFEIIKDKLSEKRNYAVENGYIISKTHDTVTKIKNEIVLDEDLMEVFGWFMAEGSISKRNISFTLSKDEKHFIDFIDKTIKRHFGITYSMINNYGSYIALTFHSSILSAFLERILNDTKIDKKINNILIFQKPELQLHLLKGAYLGDGNFNKKYKVLKIGMTNKKYIEILKICHLRNGHYISTFVEYRNKENHKPFHKISVSKINKDFIKFVNKHTNNYDKEFYENLDWGKSIINGFYLDGYYFTKITEFEKYKTNKPIEVIDITVEEDHTFIAGDYAVHNCAGISWSDSIEAFGNASKSTFKLITKLRAGIGTYLGGIRGSGADIGNGFEKHTGIIPYAKVNEAITRSSTQPNSGRSGAATDYYPFFHWEIEDILQLKNNKGSDETSVRFSDHAIIFDELFYERLEQGKDITLFYMNDVPGLYEYIGTPKFKELYEHYERKRNIQKKKIPAEYLYKRYFNERYQTARVYKVNAYEFQRHSAFKIPTFFSNLCLAGDTKVETKNGIKELKDIGVGDYVKSYNTETNQIEYKKVTASAMTNPKAEVLKIKTKNKEIICTPDHKIWTQRGYVEAKDLKENDKILTNKYEHFNIEYLNGEIPVYDITVEDNHNFYANGILVHNCTEINLPAFPDEDFTVKVKNKKEFKQWVDNLYSEGRWYPLYRHFEYGEENEVSKEMEQYLDKNGKNFVLNFGEIFSCILGGINVGILPLNKEKRIKKVKKLMDILVRFLDEMIDNQDYVNIKPFEKFTKNRRALGISPGNYFYLLARAGYDYNTEEARNLTHEIMEEILYYGLEASVNLAEKRGKCKYFKDTKYSDGILPIDTYNKNVDKLHNKNLLLDWNALRNKIKQIGLRNSTLLTIVPSSNSSRPANMISGINPPQALEPIIEDNRLKIKSLLPEVDKYKDFYIKHSAWNIDNIDYWKLVAIMQKFVDQAISLNEYVDYTKYPDKQLPYNEAVKRDFFIRKYGIKTLYYAKSKTQDDMDMEIEAEGCSGGGCTL